MAEQDLFDNPASKLRYEAFSRLQAAAVGEPCECSVLHWRPQAAVPLKWEHVQVVGQLKPCMHVIRTTMWCMPVSCVLFDNQ